MEDKTPTTPMDEQVRQLHAELRKTRPGRLTVFLGAGASCDYGIPTMKESAAMLRDVLAGKKTVDTEFSEQAEAALQQLTTGKGNGQPGWDIEQLLTRLYQLQEVVCFSGQQFADTKASIGGQELSQEAIKAATDELLKFHVEMCQLAAKKYSTREGDGSVSYLADFVRVLSSYDNMGLRLFTINIDLCIEAAITMLEHRPTRYRRPDIRLVDGFGTSIVPIFDRRNFRVPAASEYGAYPVYLWKLHGSVDWRFSLCHTTGEQQPREVADGERVIVRRFTDALAQPLRECGALREDLSDNIVVYPTPAKYSQTYTFPYMELFEAFRGTMEKTDLLLVVGTSFPDLHIRAAIRAFAHRDDTKLFVVDPSMEQSTLVKLLDDTPSLQPIIRVGLKDFVEKLKAVDAAQPVAKQA
jgi:NAD-dependent SIR2 family protein deacetylase